MWVDTTTSTAAGRLHWSISYPTNHRLQQRLNSAFTYYLKFCWKPRYGIQSFQIWVPERENLLTAFAATRGMQGDAVLLRS